VAEFPFKAPAVNELPGVLQVQQLDGLTHIVTFDQQFGEQERAAFEARLKLLGARRVQAMALGLERAVNAFLSHGHAGARRAA
jgi:ABC-2 type transport system ATP-binding protein